MACPAHVGRVDRRLILTTADLDVPLNGEAREVVQQGSRILGRIGMMHDDHVVAEAITGPCQVRPITRAKIKTDVAEAMVLAQNRQSFRLV